MQVLKEAPGVFCVPFDRDRAVFNTMCFEQVVEKSALRGLIEYMDFITVVSGVNDRGRDLWGLGSCEQSVSQCGCLLSRIIPPLAGVGALCCVWSKERGLRYRMKCDGVDYQIHNWVKFNNSEPKFRDKRLEWRYEGAAVHGPMYNRQFHEPHLKIVKLNKQGRQPKVRRRVMMDTSSAERLALARVRESRYRKDMQIALANLAVLIAAGCADDGTEFILSLPEFEDTCKNVQPIGLLLRPTALPPRLDDEETDNETNVAEGGEEKGQPMTKKEKRQAQAEEAARQLEELQAIEKEQQRKRKEKWGGKVLSLVADVQNMLRAIDSADHKEEGAMD